MVTCGVKMKTGRLGLEMVKEYESFIGKVYDDAGGKPTIGYGHLIKPGEKFDTITESEAEVILAADLGIAEDAVKSMVTVPLSQLQFDALVSLVFNVGAGNFANSTLLKCLNQGRYALAANEFQRWSYVGANRMAGLYARRRTEKIIFKAGCSQ